MKITDEQVKKLPLAGQRGAPSGKPQYIERDDDLKGFLVVVGKSDVTFCYQSDTEVNGVRQSKREAVGRFYKATADVPKLTAKEARAIAQDRLGGIKTGRIQIVRNGVTLRAAWSAYKLYLQRQKRSEGTIWHYGDAIERTLGEWLDKPLKWLCDNPQAVRRKYDAIIEQVIAKRAPAARGQANERGVPRAQGVMRVLSAVYGYAQDKLDRSLPERSPVTACDMIKLERRQTGMAAVDFNAWALELEAKGKVNEIRREFHLFMALCGARPKPICAARWSDLDLRRRVLKVTEDKTRAIDIPLSWAIVRCLQRLKRIRRKMYAGSEFIFPAHSTSGHIADGREDRTKVSKFNNDLRQSLLTMASDIGVSELHMKLMAGHSIKGDVTMGYINRSKLDERRLRASQERVSRYLVHHLRLPFDSQMMKPRAVWDGATW